MSFKGELLPGLAGEIRTEFFSDGNGHRAFRRTQDVTAVLDHNTAVANSGDRRHNPGILPQSVGRKIASIPLVTYERWNREYFLLHGITLMQAPALMRHAFIRRKLNDREYFRLRTDKQ